MRNAQADLLGGAELAQLIVSVFDAHFVEIVPRRFTNQAVVLTEGAARAAGGVDEQLAAARAELGRGADTSCALDILAFRIGPCAGEIIQRCGRGVPPQSTGLAADCQGLVLDAS